MAKKSTIIKNWPKYLLQWGILAALIVFLTGIIPSENPADPEAYCPMGGLQALATYLANNSLPCSMSMFQIAMGLVLAAAVILFSKLFCAFICPLGTVQDLLSKARNAMHLKGIRIANGSVLDKVLRIVKYVLVFWIFYMTMTSSELFCKNLDPYYAIATGFKGEITLWMSIVTICIIVLGGFFIDMFWCRYICPLGAISNSLKFWLWIGVLFGVYYVADVLGASIPWPYLLGAFCLVGYLLEILVAKPKLQILHVIKDAGACNGCGLCEKKCPYHINIKSFDSKVNHVDCTLCGECVAACTTKALNVGVCKPTKSRVWNFIPAVLTVALVIFGLWAGSKLEIPTIDLKWDIEYVEEDGSVTQLVDESTLKTTTIEGLRSVTCYGSSMAFKAKLERINGVHGVKVFVKRHTADVLYNPAEVTPEQIQEAIYVPSKFEVNDLVPGSIDSLKVVTIRTEGMYDRMDINYLGLQMRQTDKKIYGLETEFACPLIVRVYMDPSENIEEDWFEDLVEMDVLQMPVHGGETVEIEVDFKFVKMEDEVGSIASDEFIKRMFTPVDFASEARAERLKDEKQYIYEIADPEFDKPLFSRYVPYLYSHLSKEANVIGVYINLNKDLIPALQIRYARPVTADIIWEKMNAPKWQITYSNGNTEEIDAMMGFDTPGVELEF